jgi:hypothetical protein
MKTTILLLVLVLAPMAATFLARPVLAQKPDRSTGAKESPLACDREALTPQQRKRHFDELGPAAIPENRSSGIAQRV